MVFNHSFFAHGRPQIRKGVVLLYFISTDSLSTGLALLCIILQLVFQVRVSEMVLSLRAGRGTIAEAARIACLVSVYLQSCVTAQKVLQCCFVDLVGRARLLAAGSIRPTEWVGAVAQTLTGMSSCNAVALKNLLLDLLLNTNSSLFRWILL